MPAMVAIMLIMLTGYQLFFRYESWPSDKHDGVVYERDNMSGATRMIKPGERVNFMARLLGDDLAKQLVSGHRPPNFDEAFNFSMIDVSKSDVSKPGQAPDSQANSIPATTLAPPTAPVNNSAPVPANPANPKGPQNFSTQKIDLNNDNETEEVIQRVTANDGLVDISIVRHGREIFYGRGRQLTILNTRHDGWLDIALDTGEKKPIVYGFSRGLDSYKFQAGETAKR